jgi:hypothetical protein
MKALGSEVKAPVGLLTDKSAREIERRLSNANDNSAPQL